MGKIFSLKPRINKSNGQINISLPKKKLPSSLLKDIDKIKCLKMELESWEE